MYNAKALGFTAACHAHAGFGFKTQQRICPTELPTSKAWPFDWRGRLRRWFRYYWCNCYENSFAYYDQAMFYNLKSLCIIHHYKYLEIRRHPILHHAPFFTLPLCQMSDVSAFSGSSNNSRRSECDSMERILILKNDSYKIGKHIMKD